MGNLLLFCPNRHEADDALLLASFDRDLASVQRLLFQEEERHVVNVNATNNREKKTPLHWACYNGHLEICQLLLEHGADVNARESNGKTPIHWASFYFCQAEICQLLVEHGADLNAKENDDGMTPLHLACRNHGDTEMIQLLIENGAKVNAKNNAGLTPLHLACGGGEQKYYCANILETIQLLIDSGADVNRLGLAVHLADRMTPLHLACQDGHLKVVQLLLSRGAIVDGKTARGYTPLELASEQQHVEVVWFMVRQYPWLVSEKNE